MKATRLKSRRSVGDFSWNPGETRLRPLKLKQKQKEKETDLLGEVKEIESALLREWMDSQNERHILPPKSFSIFCSNQVPV